LKGDQEKDGQPTAMKMDKARMDYALLLPLVTTYGNVCTRQLSTNFEQSAA
jgi:hypothetical protein